MEVFDFITDADGDIGVQNGDFAFGESTAHHQRDIMLAQKGAFRQFPLIGVGIHDLIRESFGPHELKRLIQVEMERDGMVIERLRIKGGLDTGAIDLVAEYNG